MELLEKLGELMHETIKNYYQSITLLVKCSKRVDYYF